MVFSILGAQANEISINAESVGRIAVQRNPELRAARYLIAEAEGRARMTGRLSNPEIDGEFAGGPDFEGRVAVGVTQRFPLTSRLRLERQLSALQIEGAKLEVRERERQIAIAARGAFYALATAREAVSLARQQTDVARQFAKTLKDGSAEGFGSSLDAEQASIDAEILSSAEQPFRVDEVQAATRLALLFGVPAETKFPTKGVVVLPTAVPAKRPLGVRPDLLLAQLALETGAVDVSLAKASRWDDVALGAFAEGDQLKVGSSDVEPDTLVGIRFVVPLPLWQNGSGLVSEKEAARRRRETELEALRLSVRADLAASHQIMSIRYEAAVRAQTKLLPPARTQVSNAEAAYARGETDIQTVFRARERLVQIETEALGARKNYFLSNSEWLAALGETAK
jgi:cobalt-zinc-cadmium efflux system outer membrane protein